ncbi:DNA-3-methyladenine glycosylase I [archaeon]|nr:DNA-3-methyladenine glycosylase I [archaeon]|tara:strand:+ start:11795 stop:12355 length:561 start_codon:yes stop_codon:yes gene_type:complete
MEKCSWIDEKNPLYVKYHDKEWGLPLHDDTKLFELLILEGAQAGLSWSTILNKRENYRKAFDSFNYEKIALYDSKKINSLLQDAGIVRNKLKINSTIQNAKAFIKIRKEFTSFDKYIWSFVNNKPIKNNFKSLKDIPAKTPLSDKISIDLKKRGMNFVGSTIIYAYMQATGLVNDHQINCFRYEEV